MVLGNGKWPQYSPARSVCENNIAFFSRPLCKCYTSVFLPVTHCLTENGSLAAWKEWKFYSFSVCGSEHILTAQRTQLPCKDRRKTHDFHSELTTEIPTDHIRDDAVRPHTLRSGGGCSPPAMDALSACSFMTPGALIKSGAINWKHEESELILAHPFIQTH